MQTIYKYLSIACLLGLVACGNNDNTNQNNVNNDKDMSVDMPDMVEDDTPDICTPKSVCDENVCGMVADGCGGTLDCGGPITECPADSCGMVPDNCGGSLDCGECLCVDNMPQKASCDACGVFALTCQNNQGVCDGQTVQPLLDLTDQDCASALLYVDDKAAGGGDGSKDSPFRTLTDALAATTANTKAILIKGDGTYEGTIEIKDGVSILGGYGDDWAVDTTKNPTIKGDVKADENVFGVKAINIQQPTMVSNIIVETPDAQNGHDNYGFYAKDAPKLILNKVKVSAGKGGDGADGIDGKQGDAGIKGTAGAAGEGKYRFTLGVVTWPYNPLSLSNEGVNANCPDSAGGRGGLGGYNDNQISALAKKGDDSISGVLGGAPGVFDMSMSNLEGAPGKNGVDFAMRAADGSNGLTRIAVRDGFFVREDANGKDGQKGASGRGGGGGGGAAHSESSQNNEYILAGPQGGGGGSGGCGGTGGTGGKAGGNSFGLFVVTSNGMKVVLCSFNAKEGGTGGTGGSGGAGGVGSEGGPRTARNFSMSNNMAVNETTPRSGPGGRGGAGQGGGHGGGGAGGNSYGAYCHQTDLNDDNSRFDAGFAASGGSSPSGQSAPDGMAVKQNNCI